MQKHNIVRIVFPLCRGVRATKCGASADQLPATTGKTCMSQKSGRLKCPSNSRTTKVLLPNQNTKRQYRTFDSDVASYRNLARDLAAELILCQRQSRGGKCERGYFSGLVKVMNEKAPALDIKDYDIYNRIRKVKGRRERRKCSSLFIDTFKECTDCYCRWEADIAAAIILPAK